jgi:polysaccharide transporter, PST family
VNSSLKRRVFDLPIRLKLYIHTALFKDPQRTLQNVGWLSGEHLFNLVASFLISAWLARYLGPSQFGIYNYAISFVSLFGFLTILGLDGIVTRELVTQPQNKDQILGTTWLLRLGGSSVSLLLILLLSQLLIDDAAVKIMVAIVAVGALFEAFGNVDMWFKARTESQYSALARSSALVVSALLTAALILMRAPLLAFVVVIPARQAVKAVSFLIAYQWAGHNARIWRHNWSMAWSYLRESWPLILSFASALIYLKIDQVMLGSMMDSREVGVYSVAARLSETWYFLGTTIAISVFPSMIKARAESAPRYQNLLQDLYTLAAWLAVAIAVVVTIVARPLILLVFGPEYADASTILSIHVWTCPAVFMGAILTKWLIAEKLYMFSLTRNLFGAVANVLLNLVLIPPYGAVGSALATLLSYMIAHYLACFADPRTRAAGIMMTRALIDPSRLLRRR